MPVRRQLSRLYLGTIEALKLEHSEVSDDKRLYCDILLDDGIRRTNVPFFGGGVDPESGNPHGIFSPPIIGQIVGIFFAHGHYENPVVAFPVPMPWERKNIEKYGNILESVDDIAIFHKSGSKVILKEDGSIESIVSSGNKDSLTEKSKIQQTADGEINITNEGGAEIIADKTTGQVSINGNFTVDTT